MRNIVREATMNDGTSVSYMVFHGADPAVVILHGLAGSSREFIGTAQALAGRRVVLIDQRGHGLSTRFPVDTSRQAFVDDVLHVIEAEGLGVVDLVGQSMGAHTAMLAAAIRPDLVRRLVLLECNANGGNADEAKAVGDYFRSWEVPYASMKTAQAALGDSPLSRAWVADLEERQDGFYPRFDPDVMTRTLSAVMSPRWDEWESINTPTLVVYAEQGMFTDEQKDQFISRGRNVSRVDLAGATHDAHLDAFDQWIDALKGFLGVR
ncbi:alpha/beta fold hydrolase [Pseudarthrobacter phenanthrenivorans]|uniref:alpha/beta fold hydrolase n=1 Tax=Pseudarthrobacter phenanthrenivorans TaxID=361575 RepID=UPI001FE71259|nr:alpha/beta hydrolase [Pseudarthrobacter phenanthrenivorans]